MSRTKALRLSRAFGLMLGCAGLLGLFAGAASAAFLSGAGDRPCSNRPRSETSEPVATCVPEKPKPGERIEIRYHAGLEASRFSPGEAVLAAVTIVFQNHGYVTEGYRMDPDGSDLVARLMLPANAAFLSTYFLTLSSESADMRPLRVLVYGGDGRPVRNAMAASIDGANFHERAGEELALYPDNLAVYRDKWFFFSTGGEAEGLKTIAHDMSVLEGRQGESPEALYARSYGYLLLKNESRGREMLKRLLARHPLHPLAGPAVESYFYQAMVNNYPAEASRDADAALEKTASEYPQSPAARAWLGNARPCPAGLAVRICDAWIAAENRDPYAYQMLAFYLNQEGDDLNRAAWAAEKSLELALAGQFRILHDPFGKRTEFHLGVLYQMAASIRLKLGDHVRALAYLAAAQKAPGATPKTFYLEGEARAALGDLKAAERLYAEAWNKGVKEAGDKLREIFNARRGSGSAGDFESYLRSLSPSRQGQAQNSATPQPAPRFAAVDLEGKTIDSAALAGRIIVLNFWFVGCGPCKAEIPDLNKLAAKYPEALFVGAALTDAETLRKFLNDNPFRYRIVPSAESLAEAFGVKIFPTHIVIDAKGQIYFTRVGGGPSIFDELSPVLDRLTGR